jgi:dienelactone hydrolase
MIRAVTISLPINATYSVDARTVELTDHNRTYDGQPRRIMTTAYFPVGPASVCQPYTVPYWPNLTASINAIAFSTQGNFTLSNSTFEGLRYQLCGTSDELSKNMTKTLWPVALFPPGLGAVRQLYSALASEVASKGYIVITIDTPGQSYVVEYSNAPPIFANLSVAGAEAAPARTQDILTVKEAISHGRFLPYSRWFRPDHSRIVAWGHSLGGASAAEAVAADASLRGGINFDGTIYDTANRTGVDQPFLIWIHDGDTNTQLTEFAGFFNRSTGPELQLELFNSVHGSFSDMPLIVDVLGLARYPSVRAIFGPLNGRRVLDILGPYVDGWFQFCFGKAPGKLSRGPT